MLDTPQITQSAAQLTAIIRFTIPRAEIQKVMGPAIGEVLATIAAQGIAPAGPVFSHHFKMDPAIFDFEVGVPVSKTVTAAGRVQPSQLPATQVARTVYQGPYEGLGPAWSEFCEWIAANGHARVLRAKADPHAGAPTRPATGSTNGTTRCGAKTFCCGRISVAV